MKAHEYWSVGALITMLGTFYSGYKGSKSSHKYFASSSLLCMIMAITAVTIDMAYCHQIYGLIQDFIVGNAWKY